ncbi:DUF6233 domain-containing protein [Streptomyces shaanxiensis]|uniref:DUF6233 domain-containing protein n=1 Tax=Streptomyces shaanxiensis TaxID=653357 RepID=UPI003CD0B3EE
MGGRRPLPRGADRARPQFVVQQKRTLRGPEPAIVHVGDCTLIEGTPPIGSASATRVSRSRT